MSTYIDQTFAVVLDLVSKATNFVMQYSYLFVWGFVAIMVSKMLKIKLDLGLKK